MSSQSKKKRQQRELQKNEKKRLLRIYSVKEIVNYFSNHTGCLGVVVLLVLAIGYAGWVLFGLNSILNLFGKDNIQIIHEGKDIAQEGKAFVQGDVSSEEDISLDEIIGAAIFPIKFNVRDSLLVGKCPNRPCYEIRYEVIDLTSDSPQIVINLGGTWDGIIFPGHSFATIYTNLKKGHGFRARTKIYDIYFEILDDTYTGGRVIIVAVEGTLKEGTMRFERFPKPVDST